jgi:hypothetical protein
LFPGAGAPSSSRRRTSSEEFSEVMPQRKKRRVMPSVGFFSCTVIFVMLILRSFKLKGRKSVVGLSDDGQDDDFALLAVVNALLACDCLRHKLLEVEISSFWYLPVEVQKIYN